MAYMKTLYERTGIKQLAILLMASVMLISCGESTPNPMCVASDNLGDLLNKSTQLDSKDSDWVDTGLYVERGKKLDIRTSGSMYLCLGDPIVAEEYNFSPSPTNGNWQDSGIVIKSGYEYSISSAGNYSNWSSGHDCGSGDDYIGGNCWTPQDSGKGLFAYIGNTPPDSAWFGDSAQLGGSNINFFEMYNRSGDAPGYNGVVGSEGKLWFRYRDAVVGAAENQSWVGDYSDNQGGYAVTVRLNEPCYGTDGKFIKAKISKSANNAGTDIDLDSCSIASSAVNSNASDNVCQGGLYSTTSSPKSGTVFVKIEDTVANGGDGDYTIYDDASGVGSNTGSYLVSLTTVKPENDDFSSLVNSIVDPIRNILLGDKTASPPKAGLTEIMYKGITMNGEFVQGVRALMALSIVLFAFSYMAGLSKITHKELLYLVIKMSLVIAMIGPDSWEFFSEYLFSLFIEGTDSLIFIMSSSINDLVSGSGGALMSAAASDTGAAQGSAVFGFLNNTLSIIFSQEANIKLLALLATFPIGFILALVVYIGIFFFLYALVKALLAYLIAIIMTALLIFLAPIFMCFILFSKTKPIFDKWIRQLVSFSLQPILLFMVLAIFNVFIVLSLYNILNFSACYTCVFEVDLPISEVLSLTYNWIPGTGDVANFDKFCVIHGYLPWGIDSSQDTATKLAKTPVGLLYAIMFVILANVMVKFIDWVESLANILTASGALVGISSGVNNAVSEAGDIAKTTGKIGTDTLGWAARSANLASGGKISDAAGAAGDKAKVTARKILPRFVTKGGKDEMGRHVAVSESFMTRAEKKGYNLEKADFKDLNPEQRQAFKDRKRDERDIYKISNHAKGTRDNIRAAQLASFAARGNKEENDIKAAKNAKNAKKAADVDKKARGANRAMMMKESVKNLKDRTPDENYQMSKGNYEKIFKDREKKVKDREIKKALEKGGEVTGWEKFKALGSNERILRNREAEAEELRKKDVDNTRHVKTSDGRTIITKYGKVISENKDKE